MRLKTKIIVSFVCVSLLLAAIGFISNRTSFDIRQRQIDSVNEASEVVISTGKMERSLYQSLIFLNGVRESKTSKNKYESIQELPAAAALEAKFDEELNKFEQALDSLKLIVGENSGFLRKASTLTKSYDVYKSISAQWLQLGAEDFEKANLMFINSIEPYFRNNIIPEVTELRKIVLALEKEQGQKLEESLEKVILINYAATVISVLLALLLAVYIYRSIANPLAEVSASAKKLGEGKLNKRIQINSKGEIGELADAFNNMAEGLQKETVSKAYVDNIIESIREALFVTDKEGRLTKVNSAASSLLGYTPQQLLNMKLSDFYPHPKAQEKQADPEKSFEYSLMHKNGTVIPVLFSEAKLSDNQGEWVGSVSVASNITAQKSQEKEMRETLKEKEVMLAEIHHRVKNNLAVISGLLQLQAFSAENTDVQKALSDSQLRIHTMALIHEMLYQSQSLAYIKYDTYVNELLETISDMYADEQKHIRLKVAVEPMHLSINKAIPCSLLINELVVNSFKHAFANQKEGVISIDMKQTGELITLRVSDDGNGFSEEQFNKADTLGATLIRTLCDQLKADFSILDRTGKEGSAFKVTFIHQGT